MLFPTFDFLLFALPTLVVFWLLAGRPVARTVFLLGASYLFYMAGPKTEPPPAPWYYVGLLLGSTVLDYVCGREIHRLEPGARGEGTAAAGARRRRRLWLTASLVGNLGVLGYFKYANFFIEATVDVLGALGIGIQPRHLDVILPLGISFYTFQSLSYTLDVYRGRLTPETSFRRFALFVVFFPQLVAGPIVRARQFLPQLHRGPVFTRAGLEDGAFRVVRGLVKKVVLGDFIAASLTDRIFDAPQTFTSEELMLALYAYTLQIYADFSGYSDIAIGMGKLLGFEIPENFDRPYQARDIAEYWRRWHMTLSSWLRDYLFFPVLARLGPRGGYPAVWLTMFLVGMWHGASWNFVIYANLHAAAVVYNRWNRRRKRNLNAVRVGKWMVGLTVWGVVAYGLGTWVLALEGQEARYFAALMVAVALVVSWIPERKSRILSIAHILFTFHYLILSRIFFRSPDLETSRAFVSGLVRFDGLGIRPGLTSPWVYALLVFGLAYHFTPRRWVDANLRAAFSRTPGIVLGGLFMALLYGLMRLLEGLPRAFIYFQF